MIYDVIFALEAIEDVLRIALASQAKVAVVNASNQLRELLKHDPATAGKHLREGLYAIDCKPLRAFYVIKVADRVVEVVNVKQS